MYQTHYGLRARPFELTTDSKFLFLAPAHREALSGVEYGLAAAKSMTLLIGEAGTGKTTLLNAALESDRCRHVTCIAIHNPTLTRQEFVATLASRFALGDAAAGSKAVLLDALELHLRAQRAAGRIVALVIDEAQRLSRELLEEIRLLGNLEGDGVKLLPLVIAGQPELGELLEDSGLRQLKQRVALRCVLTPFTLAETAAYIAARITTAGGVPSTLFTQEAITAIHAHAGGIPRTINVICDNALLSGMALGRRPIDRGVVLEVCRDLALRSQEPLEQQESAAAADDATPRAAGQGRLGRARFALFRAGRR